MKPAFLLLPLLCLSTAATAVGTSDVTPEAAGSTGNAGGFSAKVMVTPDKDWQEKWSTPENEIPRFSAADSVAVGETITVLTFFSNPAAGVDGKVEVRCDLKMIKPGGTVGTDLKDVLCFPQVALPRPQNVQLASLAVMFQAEESDPKGVWTAQILVHDVPGNRSVPLKATFRVK
jgi:hypothetical protein